MGGRLKRTYQKIGYSLFLGGKGTPSKISKKIAFFEQIQGYKFFVEGSGLLQHEAKIEKW